MEVSILIPEYNDVATVAELIDNHADILNMDMIITVGLFNSAGDRLKVFTVEHKLTELPIPSIDEQWGIVKPSLDAMQAENPALPQE